MDSMPPDFPTLERDGWTLLSAEEHHARAPRTFQIPARSEREALKPGEAAKLLFDIETREGGRIVSRGVDRMWVIVKKRVADRYVGVLDNDPGRADGLALRAGSEVLFSAEHVAAIDRPPQGYLVAKYGPGFFEPRLATIGRGSGGHERGAPMVITEFDRWVGENNIPDAFEYGKGWWDYVELVRRFSSKFELPDVKALVEQVQLLKRARCVARCQRPTTCLQD